MTTRHNLQNLIKEIEAVGCDLRKLAKQDEETMRSAFHDQVTNVLKSLVARAENMEAHQKQWL